MNKRDIIWIIITILVLFGFVVGYEEQKFSGSVEKNSNAVAYYCEEGVLNAIYSTSSVSLSLKDGRTIVLPQVMSGSGIRYEFGTTTFVSKGDNAFLTEGNAETYTKCVAGKETSDQNINTYTDTSKTFSFSYPNQFVLSGGDIGYSQDWSAATNNLGLLLTVVNIPRTFFTEKTNFGEAKFTVGTSADPDAVKNCLEYNYGETGTTSEVMIGSRQFTKINFTDAGAGNYYDTTSYRIIYNNQCYAIEYTIHSTNIYNYSPDQGVKEFDKAKVTSILESIVQSFRFL